MKRMLVNVNDPEERRIAIVEDGKLQELHVELADRESYLGNIYKGKVVNIEPSIGAAFVNFGGTRNGFLHASDVVPGYGDASVDLLDILEGRSRLSEEDDGPDAVRSILDDSDDGDEADADDGASRDKAGRTKRRGKKRRGRGDDADAADAADGRQERSSLATDGEAVEGRGDDDDADEDIDDDREDDDDDVEHDDDEDADADADADADEDEDEDLDREGFQRDAEVERELDDDYDDGLDSDDDSDDDDDDDDDDDSASDDFDDDERSGRGPFASMAAGTEDDDEDDAAADLPPVGLEASSDDSEADEQKRRRRRRRRRRRDGDVASSEDRGPDSASSVEDADGVDEDGASAVVEDFGTVHTRSSAPRTRPVERGVEGAVEGAVAGGDAEDADDGDAPEYGAGLDAPRDDLGEDEARGGSEESPRAQRPGRQSKDNGRLRRTKVPIQDLLKKGQEVVVQITKEGIGAKGPTLTTYLSLPGRSLVLMPSLPKCGVSRKIEDERERRRLKRIVRDLDSTGSGGIGFIVRTAGIGKSAQDLERDLEYLQKLWGVVVQRAKVTRPPAPLYVESDLVLRTMRDLFSPDIDEVVIDHEGVYQRVRDFASKLMPRFVERIKHHAGIAPLFHSYGLESAVESLYQAQVDLKHGSSIVIEQTEALVAIDVNSGRYKPGANLEETAFKTNLEAIPEIVRQLKLRDLGGVIIVDFIDMQQEKHRRAVERRFRDALKGDRARINVGRISIFGTLELTRQRVGPGLKRTVFKTCPLCKGTSLVRTVASKSLAVLRSARALARLPGYERLEVYANPEVCEFLGNRKRRDLIELEELCNRFVLLRSEPSYPVDVVHYRFLDSEGRETKVNIPAGLGVKA